MLEGSIYLRKGSEWHCYPLSLGQRTHPPQMQPIVRGVWWGHVLNLSPGHVSFSGEETGASIISAFLRPFHPQGPLQTSVDPLVNLIQGEVPPPSTFTVLLTLVI